MTENAVKDQTEQVKPAPVTQPATAVTAPATVEVKPTETNVEDVNKKQTAAFIKMRQEKRELKDELAKVKAAILPAPASVVEPQAQSVPKEVAPAPAPVQAASSIEEESRKAIEVLSIDKDIAAMPGALMDIIDMVDTDPRLVRLHNVDPTIAFREAKGVYLAKAGIAPAPSVPLSTTSSGGMGSGGTSLSSLFAEIGNHAPGSKMFSELTAKINAEMKKL